MDGPREGFRRLAEARARHIVDTAEADARRTRLECEDYCDKKLGSFEIVFARTMKLVVQGRQRLQLSSSRMGDAFDDEGAQVPVVNGHGDPPAGFFDQDQG